MINNNIDFSSTTISITVLWTNISFYFWSGLIDVHLTYHIHYDKKNHNITPKRGVCVSLFVRGVSFIYDPGY